MKRFSEQLKKRADGIRMSASEKAHLRERVLSFMEYHPLPEGQSVDLRRTMKSQASAVSFWNTWMVGRFAGGFAVLLLVTVPALAENALPGEALYPVKVRFNEEIRGALNSSPYQKIEWETERLERRLAEAQLLADAGRLTPETEAEVASAIKRHSLTAKNSIETMRLNDSDEATMAEITLSSALEVSAEVLNRREHQSSPSSVSLLSGAVNEARANIAPANENLSYARLLSRVEGETTRAYEYLGTLRTSITEAERNDIGRRLTDVKTNVETAAAVKEEDEAAAVRTLTEALISTRKLISFMTNLEVRRSVTVNELVPIVLTNEEKKEKLMVRLNEVARISAAVEAESGKMATSSNDHMAVTDTLKQLRELKSEAEFFLAEGDIATAEAYLGEASELAEALKSTMAGLGFNLQLNVGGSAR